MDSQPLKPNTSWYTPVKWSDLVQAASEKPDSAIEEGEVPWSNYKAYAISCLHSEIDGWYSKTLSSGKFQQIEGTKENGYFLDFIRELMLGLADYSDTQEVLAWSVQQEKEIEVIEQSTPIIRLLFGGKAKLQERRQALERYDQQWQFKNKFRQLESSLIKEYENYALAILDNLNSALNSRAKFASKRDLLKPKFRPIYTPTEFEHYCSEWMVFLGFREVKVSKASGDGGVDVFARGAVAQVKFYNTPIGVGPIRELLGASLDFASRPIFFSSMSYTQAALDFADRNGVSLFIVDIFESDLKAVSRDAKDLLAT